MIAPAGRDLRLGCLASGPCRMRASAVPGRAPVSSLPVCGFRDLFGAPRDDLLPDHRISWQAGQPAQPWKDFLLKIGCGFSIPFSPTMGTKPSASRRCPEETDRLRRGCGDVGLGVVRPGRPMGCTTSRLLTALRMDRRGSNNRKNEAYQRCLSKHRAARMAGS